MNHLIRHKTAIFANVTHALFYSLLFGDYKNVLCKQCLKKKKKGVRLSGVGEWGLSIKCFKFLLWSTEAKTDLHQGLLTMGKARTKISIIEFLFALLRFLFLLAGLCRLPLLVDVLQQDAPCRVILNVGPRQHRASGPAFKKQKKKG